MFNNLLIPMNYKMFHPLVIKKLYIYFIVIIHYVCMSVCLSDGGFGGWGRERSVKQWATGVNL